MTTEPDPGLVVSVGMLETDSPMQLSSLSTHRQDLTSALLGLWITAGGFVDGFAHRNLDTPETFFTPWHGILYSGYLAAVGWVVYLVLRNRERAPSLIDAIPQGYRTSVIGLAVFAAGGIGDMFWHTIFGIEVSIDALTSPTHLLLLVGSLMYLSGPLKSRLGDASYHPSRLRDFWPPLLALSLSAAEVGFFFQYMDGFSSRQMQIPYVPGSEEGAYAVIVGMSSILITTVIGVGALLLLMKLWELPFGSGLVMFGLFGGLMELLEGYQFTEDVVAPLVAGLAVDLIIRYARPRDERRFAMRWFAFLVPAAMWTTRFVVFEQFSDIRWPIEIWTGAVILAGLTGVGLSLLAFPFTRSNAGRVSPGN